MMSKISRRAGGTGVGGRVMGNVPHAVNQLPHHILDLPQ